MAVDPYILLQGRVPDAVGAFGRGYGLGQEIKEAPLRNRLLEQQVEAGDAQNRARIDTDEIRSVVLGAERVRPFIERGDLEGAKRYLQNRIAVGPQSESGRTNGMGDTQEFLDQINAGVPAEQLIAQLDEVRNLGANLGMYPGMSRPSSEYQTFDRLTRDLSPEDRERAKRIELGLDPRAVGSAAITIAETGRTGQVAGSQAVIEGEKAGAKELAQLEAQGKLKPAIASAIRQAEEQAKLNIARQGDAGTEAIALNMYETAMSGLSDALGNTETGPVYGLVPAITSNQQIADGAIAAMAPILKGLFRTAGEGTFTDKDQELLTAMIPTRKDSPEARAAKIENIDAIVRAKLSKGAQVRQDSQSPAPAAQPAAAQPKRYRFNPQTGRLE